MNSELLGNCVMYFSCRNPGDLNRILLHLPRRLYRSVLLSFDTTSMLGSQKIYFSRVMDTSNYAILAVQRW